MYLFLKSELNLDGLADALKDVLNLPVHNRRREQYEQRRYSLNKGGDYYLFELIGIELWLISNAGEVLCDEHPDYQFYLVIAPDNRVRDFEMVRGLIGYLAKFLTAEGFEVYPEPDLS